MRSVSETTRCSALAGRQPRGAWWAARGLGLAVLVALGPAGCLPDAPGLACGADGVTPRCTTPGSECRAGYCAVRAADCASGWRFTDTAATPRVCAPATSADAGAVDVQAVDDGVVDDRPVLDDAPHEAGADAVTADVGVDAGVDVSTDLGLIDAGVDGAPDAPDVPADVGFDAGPRDAGSDVGLDAGPRDAGSDVGFDAGPRDAGVDARPVDTGIDVGVDAGLRDTGVDVGSPPPGPVLLLEPITNARVRGDRVRFRARVGAPSYNLPLQVRVYGPDCNALSATRLALSAPGYEATLLLAPGIHCYDVVRGDETVVRQRRFLVEGGVLQGAPTSLVGGFLQDFDRSGMTDVLVGRVSGSTQLTVATPIVLDANHAPQERPSLAPPSGGQGAAALRGWYAGDLDNDGYGDVIVLYRLGVNGEAWWQLLRHRGGPAGVEVLGDVLASVREADAPGYALVAGAVPDLDDDGVGELVLVHGAPMHGVELRTSRRGFALAGDVMRVEGTITHAVVLPPTAPGVSASVAWAGTRVGPVAAIGVVEYQGTNARRVEVTLSQVEDRAAPAAIAGGFDMLGSSFGDFAYVAGAALRVVHFDPAAASGRGAYVVDSSWSSDSVIDSARLVGLAPVTRFMGDRDVVVMMTGASAYVHAPGGRRIRSLDVYHAPLTALGTTAFGMQGSLLVARPSTFGSTETRLFRVAFNDQALPTSTPLMVPAAVAPLWLSR